MKFILKFHQKEQEMRDASRGLIALLVAFAFVMTAAVAFAAKHV